jgi:anthraniloyl-CoA monooxygenase
MKVNTIGGGPGGLYASLLLKKNHPDWDVTVYEQNPPGVTYGWGIVFPNRALPNLAEADPPSHEAIQDTFNHWEPFDIFYRGERYRSGGHAFASMMRTDLLAVLQERCRELDVDLQFETEITDPTSIASEADLCIVADGINSATRDAYSDEFETDIVKGTAQFSWFGTEQQFDALTHIFVENDDGIWSAHTYPGRVSTFIIDCDAETWKRSGVADMSEDEYHEYFEDVFAEYLDGHELLSQQDRWRTFQTVRNGSWSHDNMVLVGDAAHTAHYSIGSGTTLALEDGIGLMEAFESHDDVDDALTAYERSRKPIVESLMAAAERSRIHFEDIRRYFDLPAQRFVLHHLTRSGRLTYGSLQRRDASLTGAFDEWFAEQTPGDDVARPPAQQPLRLGSTDVANRYVRTVGPTATAEDGIPSPSQCAALDVAAMDAPGLLLTEPLAVSASGRPSTASPGIYTSEHAEVWADTIGGIDDSVTVGAHLVHAGTASGREAPAFDFDEASPREDTWAPRRSDSFPTPPRAFDPEAMGGEQRETVREQFTDAARRADDAGFDYLQIHGSSNTLLGQTMVTQSEPVDDRTAFTRSVVEAVRTAWPGDKPLGFTLPVSNRTPSGLSLDDAFTVATAVTDAGCDLVAPVDVANDKQDPAEYGPSDYSDAIRNELEVPTMATVPTTSVNKVNTLVATGRADLCTFPIQRPLGDDSQ